MDITNFLWISIEINILFSYLVNYAIADPTEASYGYWDIVRPNDLDTVALYLVISVAGLVSIIIAAFLLLLLFITVDSISTTTVAVDKKIKRHSIPKIILDREVRSQEYEEMSWDDVFEANEGPVNEAVAVDPAEVSRGLPKEDKKISIDTTNAENHLQWLKTTYILLLVHNVMQKYLNNNTRCLIED